MLDFFVLIVALPVFVFGSMSSANRFLYTSDEENAKSQTNVFLVKNRYANHTDSIRCFEIIWGG